MLTLNWYGVAALMSGVTFGCLWTFNRMALKGCIPAPFRPVVRLNYGFLALALMAVVAVKSSQSHIDLFAVKVEIDALMTDLAGPSRAVFQAPAASLPEQSTPDWPVLPWVSYLLGWCYLIGAMFFFFRDVVEFLRLRSLAFGSTLLHSIGDVRVVVTDSCTGAFSWRGWRRAWIVVPSRYLSSSRLLLHAVRHELGHHRNDDTRFCYLDRLFVYLFWFNPMVHFWVASLNELREFANDQELVQKRKLDLHQYCHSLVEAASMSSFAAGNYAMGMAGQPESILSRRIKYMLKTNWQQKVGKRFLGFVLIIGTAIVGGALVATAAIDGAPFNQTVAKDLQTSLNDRAQVRVELNQEVTNYLEKFIGTKEGRAHVKNCIERLEQHKDVIQGAMARHEMPKELLAIAMIESGFENLPPERNKFRSAGVWQFIPATARRFNLRVKGDLDDRLDVALASDAAMRYLKKLYLQFGSWPLAVIAYNGGEQKLLKGIFEIESRDPWKLIAAGFGGDPGYLAKYMAAAMALHYYEVL